MRKLLLLALFFGVSTLSLPLAHAQVILDKSEAIKAGGRGGWSLTLGKSCRVTVRIDVKTATPLDIYLTSPDEYENMKGFGLAGGSFSYFKAFYREQARNFNETQPIQSGKYILVLFNKGAKDADLHVKVSLSPLKKGDKLLSLPKPKTGNQGSTAGTGRYELAITRFVISKKKRNGKAWDVDRSAADVKFSLLLNPGITKVERKKAGNHKNRRIGKGPEEERWVFNWDGKSPIILMAHDKDAFSSDFIGCRKINKGTEPGQPRATLDQSHKKTLSDGRVTAQLAEGSVKVLLAWKKIGELSKGFGE